MVEGPGSTSCTRTPVRAVRGEVEGGTFSFSSVTASAGGTCSLTSLDFRRSELAAPFREPLRPRDNFRPSRPRKPEEGEEGEVANGLACSELGVSWGEVEESRGEGSGGRAKVIAARVPAIRELDKTVSRSAKGTHVEEKTRPASLPSAHYSRQTSVPRPPPSPARPAPAVPAVPLLYSLLRWLPSSRIACGWSARLFTRRKGVSDRRASTSPVGSFGGRT